MADLAGSKTANNLKEAFVGESQANRRYHYFAKQADIEGYPEVAAGKAEAVAAAGRELGDLWCQNVFPSMDITWGTYRSDIGHPDMSTEVGCFRCHGGDHVDEKGDAISLDCTICHNVLADREKNPEILKTLVD